LCWYSRGAASAVATKLTLASGRNHPVVPVTCRTGAEHPDNDRFQVECEAWFGKPVTALQSTEYRDTWEVWEKRRYIAGISGAPCTVALKVAPRLDFQRPDDIHVFGYTADAEDIARAKRLREHFFELTIETPLIDKGVTKAACLEMVTRAGLKLPLTYAQGFPNANCLPCPKATSPAYWALVRKHYPDRFNRMATLSRELGARLARVKDERVFIDEIPADQPMTNPIVPSCDFLCAIAEMDMSPIRTNETGEK
jgi:3'-phosphoadenosine 5'-phosphosulfate sulfotransferase (PAPS reductase)/FAD synthetase